MIEKGNIGKIRIPFVVYTAGYNYFRREGLIPPRAIDHLKDTQYHALFFSVRNDRSYDRLRMETGIEVGVIADPGFWLSLYRKYSRPVRKPYAMIQLADKKPTFRFGTEENRERFIQGVRVVIRHLSRQAIARDTVSARTRRCGTINGSDLGS